MQQLIREILQNWTLVYLSVVFLVIVVWVLAGKRSRYRDTARMIFEHDDRPAPDAAGPGKEPRR